MAQAFVTTYQNYYRWNTQPKVPLVDPDKLTKLQPEGDIWLLDANEKLDEELKNLEEIKKSITNLYLKRMKTTYRVSYCENIKQTKKIPSLLSGVDIQKSTQDLKKIEPKESAEDFENELLEYCKKLYGPRESKITPPLNSSRNIFGYMRPGRLRMPLTMYQNEYGRVGYNVLRAGYNNR